MTEVQNTAVQVLESLWKDKHQSSFEWKLFIKRMLGMALFLTLAQGFKNLALSTVRWPEPIKYIGIALILVAVGLFLWGVIILWKLLCQLRLKGLLIVLGIIYGVSIAISVLISDSSLPILQRLWLTTGRLLTLTGRRIYDVGQTIVQTPEKFRFAYTGHRRPILLPGMDPSDTSYLTPIPANRPVQQETSTGIPKTPAQTFGDTTPLPTSEVTKDTTTPVVMESVVSSTPVTATTSTPAATSTKAKPTRPLLQPPDCPHPLARLTMPRVNEVINDEIEVEGSANIENLGYYKFEFKREDGEVEDEWHWVASFEDPVEEGVLGIWRASHLPEGIYTFRLTVVNKQGNYPFPPCDVRVQIKH